MAKLQSIEQALLAINPTIFQELCDSVLVRQNKNYKAFSRIGSQTGKQKTTRGTPDSFFLLPNGNYICVEITTDISTKNKLANDIKACFDPQKSKIPIEKIEQIVLCFNWKISPNEIEELNQLACSFKYGINIDFWSLDSLSVKLKLNHRDLAQEYLDLPFDTGQIVSLDKFVDQYNNYNQGIAIRIDNKFLHRDSEREELKTILYSYNFVILTGSPGVGKTKLAIEVIKEFLRDNSNFNAFAIFNKSYPLLEDLYQYLDQDKNYLLFVDDANRLDAFEQIIGFYKTTRTGQLKIIVTVRDYAYHEISSRCCEFNPQSINLAKLNDEQIVDIIKSKDFGIINHNYQKEIVKIADGNPRIAIMASLLALEEHNINSLSDVSELFEKYFLTFIRDHNEFADDFNLKCLGIIAFFNTIPYKDREVASSILSDFDINYLEFVDAIDKLENLELVEIQFEYVKIPEQNLANFFFYKSFIKDELVSFDILLAKYFYDYSHRFRDCIIPANNTFGANKVENKLRPKLRKYLDFVKDNEEYTYKFLSAFWFYLEPETLEYIYNVVEQLPSNNITEYVCEPLANSSTRTNENILDLLNNFWRFYKNLKDTLELSFEYVRKCPELLPRLITDLNKILTFSIDDARFGFYRQSNLFDILINALEIKDNLLTSIFWELSKTFLRYRFESSEMERTNTIVISRYFIPNNQYIQDIRAKIWNTIDLHFEQFPIAALAVLKSYSARTPDVAKEIMQFDLPYVLEIIRKHFTDKSFGHCLYVQEQIRWWKRNEVYDSGFEQLAQDYTNPIYEMYLIMDWDRHKGKEDYEFDDWQEYEKLKESEIRNNFQFQSTDEIKVFFEHLSIIIKSFENEDNFLEVIQIIVNENFRFSFEIGYYIVDLLIDANIDSNYPFRLEFLTQIEGKEKVDLIWQLINSKEFKDKIFWKLSFFNYLNANLISDIYIQELITTLKSIQQSTRINFNALQKYLGVEPLLFQKILQIAYEINSKKDFLIYLPADLFSNYFEYLGDDLDLIKQSYIRQDTRYTPFDYRGKAFLKILKQDKNFLFEYVESCYQDRDDLGYYSRLSSDGRSLGFVWAVDGIETEVVKAFDLLLAQQPYFGINSNFCNFFFREVNDKYSSKVDAFIRQYVKDNNSDSDKINLIVDITRHSYNELFEEILLYYISLNQNVEHFKQIYWRSNGTIWTGEANVGDLEAADWRKILSIVEKSNVGFRLIPIKKYLHEKIESSLEYAEIERKRKFLGYY